LITLAGAAVSAPPTNTIGGKNYPTEVAISVEGSAGNGTLYLLDGGSNNDLFTNVSSPIPFPDAIQEFSVQMGSVPARYGFHAGAVINMVTKAGTNQIHGDLFEFLRNGDFNARNASQPARDSLKRNQFGGVIGGPVRKSKLFFFGGYQGTWTRSDPAASIVFVPTQAMLNGDFTTLASPACAGKQVTLGAPFVNNQISLSLLNPVALNVLKKVPVSPDPCGKYQYGIANPQREHQVVGKMDYIRSEKNTLIGRYLISDYINPDGAVSGNLLTTTRPGLTYRDQNLTLGDSYVFSPGTINSVHLTVMRNRTTRAPAPFAGVGTDYGIKQSNPVPNLFIVSISNGFNVGSTGGALAIFDPTNVWLTDDIDLIRGKHQLAFGGMTFYNQFNSYNNQLTNGQWTFNGSLTGLGLADFMVGKTSNYQQGNNGEDYNRSNYYSLYAQDSWRVNSRLNVNYGIRWEPYLPEHFKGALPNVEHFNMGLFLKGVKSVVFPNAPAGLMFNGDPSMPGAASNIHANWNVWSPRLGMVWDPRGNGRETIRVSYSVAHEYPSMYYSNFVTNSAPWGGLLQLANPVGGFSDPFLGVGNGAPFPQTLPPPKNYTFPGFATYTSVGEDYSANLKSTYEEHWNATLQKQLGRDFILSASYLGNRTLHMWAAVNANPAVYIPGTCGSGPCSTIANTNQRRYLNLLDPVNGAYYGPIYQTNDGANAWYNAMLISVQRRFSQHYSFMANYTWSHCISEADTGGDLGQASAMVMNPSNVREDRGNCLSDRRQIFNSSIIAQTPEFASTLLRRVASGWQTSAIITAQSGNWSSVTTGSDTSLTASQAAASLQDRANVIGDWHGDGTRTNWFQRAAFVNNAPGVFGNVGRNSVLQPGAWNIDASLVRRVKVREAQTVEIRAEAYNVLNHANFGPATLSIGSGTFGKILTSGNPRICEFALKYIF
jgi:TonB dependent receptor